MQAQLCSVHHLGQLGNRNTVEHPYNEREGERERERGQVGAGAFVRYSEASFIEMFHHNNVYLTPCMVKDC